MNEIENALEVQSVLEQIRPYCAFSLGIEKLAETKPVYEPLRLRLRLALIREALACTIVYGLMPFYGLHDHRQSLIQAKKGIVITAGDILNELRTIQAVQAVIQYDKGCPEVEHEKLHDLVSTLVWHKELGSFLAKSVNEYGEIPDNASDELYFVRRQKANAEKAIADSAARFVSEHAGDVVDSIITYRNDRAVILIKATMKNAFGGYVYGDSASGQASYVEPAMLIGPNNRLQELKAREKKEEERILAECSHRIGETAEEELANLETLAELDALYAKAQWGKDQDACVAVLSEKKEIYFKKARHPLIDRKTVVYNTYHLEDPKRVLLITGPNTGGKTVSLKIIGLFTYMTYCGIPVTSEEAVLPYFDALYTDIGDDQSVAASLSSFSAHVQKQAEICKKATADSLVLLDEIGSGTDPSEGEALAIAILNELRQRGTMTIATTHYGRLKAYGRRHDDILCASVAFDMEKLLPTYQYQEGTTGSSNAFAVARRYGLPANIVKYAQFLKRQSRTEEDILIEKLEMQSAEAEKLKQELEQQKAELAARETELKKEQIRLQQQKDSIREKAQAEADAYLEKKKTEADEILAEMRKDMNASNYHKVLNTSKKLKVTEPEPEAEPVGEFVVGETVELKNSEQLCRIVEIRKKDVVVDLHNRNVIVKKNSLRKTQRHLQKEKPQIEMNYEHTFTVPPMSAECNVIGMRVDEATEKANSYLDQAQLFGLRTFRIIHGDGTGALRKAVQQLLRNNPNVKSFRLGAPNEGGTGATVVTLKERYER